MREMIRVENISKTFRANNGQVEALKNISFSIGEADIFGIIGLSGAGKSTLVRCLNLLEKPTEGNVYVDGKNLMRLSEKELRKERQDIGMIFQHFNLLMQRNVLDNVCFPLEIAGVGRKEAKKRALELLETVGLGEKAKAYPAQLSGGQKQRVAIARVLANNPKILLCDEATSALDPQTTRSILNLLKEINQKYGITIVVITHEMAVVRTICSKVAVLSHGRLVEEGTVEELFRAPRTEEAKQLISTLFGYIAGLPLGIVLTITDKEGIKPNKIVYKLLDFIVNLTRSIPFLILLILVMPLTKVIVGQTYGSTATIVPLTIAAAPFIGRMVESSLKEVDKGVIEAAQSMGAGTFTIIWKVLLAEARTSLLVGVTITVGTIFGYSAMAGVVGGGGLGDIAIRYGYYRYETDIMIVTIVILVILVQVLQGIGMMMSKKLDRRFR